MKIKFSDVKIGDDFIHELRDRVMIKLNDEAYGFSMSNAKNIKENHKDFQKVFTTRIEPNTP
ncbi:MAG: hypothetical protein ACYTXY_50390, partial [Nostoc sp.]